MISLSSLLKTKPPVNPPNILLTNACNQACPYCFAREEMTSSRVKEMSLENFNKVVKFLKKNHFETLRLMGGEPTIHSHFSEVMDISLANFREVWIFSNGVIPDKNIAVLKKHLDRLGFNFNIDTVGFEKTPALRKKIVLTVKDFSGRAKVNVGFTLSDLDKDYLPLLADFDRETLGRIGIRFGLAKSEDYRQSYFPGKEYRRVGRKIAGLVESFSGLGVKGIYLDCGLQEKMFSAKEKEIISEKASLTGWGCNGKWSSFDITPDLQVFPCFPYSSTMVRPLEDLSLSELDKIFKRECCYQP